MKAWIDPDNLADFIDGNAHFVIGIYDTTAASSIPSAYEPEPLLIAQAPINMIIKYFLSSSRTSAITAPTTAMNQFGIAFLPDLQGFPAGNHGVAFAGRGPSSEPTTPTCSPLTTYRRSRPVSVGGVLCAGRTRDHIATGNLSPIRAD